MWQAQKLKDKSINIFSKQIHWEGLLWTKKKLKHALHKTKHNVHLGSWNGEYKFQFTLSFAHAILTCEGIHSIYDLLVKLCPHFIYIWFNQSHGEILNWIQLYVCSSHHMHNFNLKPQPPSVYSSYRKPIPQCTLWRLQMLWLIEP